MPSPRLPALLLACACLALSVRAGAQERAALFAVPDLQALPADVQVMSETTVEGVVVTELTLAGAPFNGQPTRIYGFYCRPDKPGRHPAVLEVHGAGLAVLSPVAGIEYAKAGFASFTMDWAGECRERKEPRKPPFSLFNSAGNLARTMLDAQGNADKATHPPHGWKTYGPEADGIRNGVLFARRSAMFLASRPEVDPERLCISGTSAGAHLTLLVCGIEPIFKTAAVKYGRGFIRDLAFGGYFGPILMCAREQQDEWLAAFDPKHGLADYRAKMLILSGTDDIFFWMPGVLATWRAIPTDKRLMMLPNENHGQVGNWQIPLAWFRSCLGLAPAWAVPRKPTITVAGGEARLALAVQGPESVTGATFVVKRMPRAVFTWGMGDKKRPETVARWSEIPATLAGGLWSAAIPAPAEGEQIVAYANVSDAAGRMDSSDTVELPAWPAWYGRTPGTAWSQTLKAGEFKRCGLPDAGMAEAVRRTGSLRGLAKDEKGVPALGWFEYEVGVPETGWYELSVPGADGNVVITLGGVQVAGTDAQGRAGSFWLERGMAHRLRLERTFWTGFSDIREMKLRAVEAGEAAAKVRVALADGGGILRRGENVRLEVQSGDLVTPMTLGIRLVQGREVAAERSIVLPDSPGERTLAVAIPCPAAGALSLEFLLDGKPSSQRNLRALPLLAVDTAPQPAAGGAIATAPVAAIDCTATAPDYAKGETRVVSTAAGSYRETGAVGYLGHMNASEPTWFAYTVKVPEAQRLYRIEVDYPDDAIRSYVIAVREGSRASVNAYPTAGGVDSGGEFALSGRMHTHTLLHWARTTDLRVLVIPARDGRRAAAARIRVDQVQGELPLPRLPAAGGRSFANWYEEGSNFASVFGAPDGSLPGLSVAADRWARTIRHMGGDTLWMTMAVYQFGLYPSRYNVQFSSVTSTDVVRAVLLNCERYGMGFIGEFHPEARELDWPANADLGRQHLAVNREGRTHRGKTEPIYNLLWPANRAWYLGMVGEFADRYRDSPSLRGVCLRWMEWCDPGLNSFHSLEWGYDDYTIALFERASGIRIPVEAGDLKRFAKRHEWLLANQREAWIGWRCAQVEELYRQVAARVRQARPDLQVWSNWCKTLRDPREAGIDPRRLQAIPGVVITGGAPYGRREGDELVVQGNRDELVDPALMRRFVAADGRGAFLDGAGYFEATGEVAVPEDLGFEKGTRRTWMSGVVNPADRHANERYAVQLAETDAYLLADGGNAYTVGQPVQREFLAEYRWLPALPFQRREDATDPVAVWSREVTAADLQGLGARAGLAPGFHLYAVNRERYPVRLAIALERAGTAVQRPATGEAVALAGGRLELELAPYEVRGWRAPAGAAIAAVQVTAPEPARRHAQGLADFLGALAAEAAAGRAGVALRPEQAALLAERAALAGAELAKGHLWRVRTLAEERALRVIYDRLQRQPPGLRELGEAAPPRGALLPGDLPARLRAGRAQVVPAGQVAPVWPGREVLLSSDERLEVELAVEHDGLVGLQLGCLAGGRFGAIEVSVDGAVVGTVGGAGALRGLAAQPGRPQALRRGTARIALRRLDGEVMAVGFLALAPVFTDLVADRWAAIGPFPVAGVAGDRQGGELILAALRAPAWTPAEQGCDPAAAIAAGDRTLRWVPLRGGNDFVDLGAALSAGYGAISYAATRIDSPRAARVRLRYGMDYWLRIWLNGELVKEVEPHGGAPYKAQFALDLDLRPGANELLVKLAGGSGGNGFWMEVGDTGELRVCDPLTARGL
jgi:cephalosporin-C deacetylase-like acetyl esterase